MILNVSAVTGEVLNQYNSLLERREKGVGEKKRQGCDSEVHGQGPAVRAQR